MRRGRSRWRVVRLVRLLASCSIALFAVACSAGAGTTPNANGVSANEQSLAVPLSRSLAPHYVAIPLPSTFVPKAMMPSGKIAGSSGREAAVYANGVVTTIGTFYNEFAVATYVNERGEAVGYATDGDPVTSINPPGRALLFEKGVAKDLGGLPGATFSDAKLVTESGEIYGGSGSDDNSFGPRMLQLVRFGKHGGVVALSPSLLFDDESVQSYFSIDDRGTIVLTRAGNGGDLPNRGYYGVGLSVTPVIPNSDSTAAAINDRGEITGAVKLTPPSRNAGRYAAYVRSPSGLRYLPFLTGFTDMFPSGMSRKGDVVGDALAYPNTTVFVYTQGMTYDLNTLLPAHSAIAGIAAGGLADDGSFVAFANDGRTFVIRPL